MQTDTTSTTATTIQHTNLHSASASQTASALLEQELPRLKRTYEQAETNIFLCSQDGSILYANPKAYQAVRTWASQLGWDGVDSAQDLVGRKVQELFGRPAGLLECLGEPANLPCGFSTHRGGHAIELLVSAIYSPDGRYLGPVIAWRVA